MELAGRGSKEELAEAAACAVRTERRLGELLAMGGETPPGAQRCAGRDAGW
jgi:hypothetical protein